MQIRELTLKELDVAWEIVGQFYTHLNYDEFEDLIYEMRDINYTMIGVFEQEKLVAYAGVAISINLVDKRHLFVYEIIVKQKIDEQEKYKNFLISYLEDYAKMGACEKVVFSK
ncbi:GNAT family N-acetyltransferase [Sulfurimonas sp.]|uniref:GNAT family N-acetyltransferase n=1 Tax=Sulfurimonas sp. TaxID=2022749 RepID=UPI003D108FC9